MAHLCLHGAVSLSVGVLKSGRTIVSGLVGASKGKYRPGISIDRSPVIREVENYISFLWVVSGKPWAFVATVVIIATIAGCGDEA